MMIDLRLYDAILLEAMDDCETNRMLDDDGDNVENIGRAIIGCTVGIEALGSP